MKSVETQMQSVSEAKEYNEFCDSLLPYLKQAIDAGNKVTLLCKRKGDHKRPVRAGFNDPAVNNWTLEDLKLDQKVWCESNGEQITGWGFINGSMSNNRFALDVDQGNQLPAIAARVLEETGFDLMTLPRVRSGRTSSTGYHLHLRSTLPVKDKALAHSIGADGKLHVIVEVIGQGVMVVGPGSKHKSGRIYTVEQGDVYSPPLVDNELVEKILAVVRTFDQAPPASPKKKHEYQSTFNGNNHRDGDDVIQRFNDSHDIDSMLRQYGYDQTGASSWRHPNNGQNQASVTVDDRDTIRCWSPNDPMNLANHQSAGTYDAFELYSVFEFHGDKSAAFKSLIDSTGSTRKQSDSAIWDSDADKLLPSNPDKPIAAKKQKAMSALYRTLDVVPAQNIDWLWYGRIPRAMLSTIYGEGAAGKGSVLIDIAARITKGADMPDGCKVDAGKVLWISSEESASLVIKPRFTIHEGDPSKFIYLDGFSDEAKDGTIKVIPPNITNLKLLDEIFEVHPEIVLVVIDPIMSFLDGKDSRQGESVREKLDPLRYFAEKHNTAVLFVNHTPKDMKNRTVANASTGSRQFVDAARCSAAVLRDKNDKELRYFTPPKQNYAKMLKGMMFKIVDVGNPDHGKVEWLGTTDKTADEINSQPVDQPTKVDDAEEFLKDFLADGKQLSKLIISKAEEKGIAYETLKRAKKALGVKASNQGYGGQWYWSLPANPTSFTYVASKSSDSEEYDWPTS